MKKAKIKDKKEVKKTLKKPFSRVSRVKQLLVGNKKRNLALLTAAIVVIVAVLYRYILQDLPSPTTLAQDVFPISTKILDRNGKLLYEIYAEENRTPIKLSDLPDHVYSATIAIEDKNFYTHHGFDTGGIIRAAWKTSTGQRLEGGSTITQQLVKVALLSPERTITRKTKEAILTVATELLYSKNQILEMYLNHIPYGGTAYGIEAASQKFFDKPAKDLSLAEAALLAGLPQAPSRFSPFGNPESAKSRQIQVLDRMLAEKFISQEEYDEAKKDELTFDTSTIDIQAPHFVMYVREILENKYGIREVEQGGLRVTTSLDLDLQKVAEASLSAELKNISKLKISNGAALITNPGSGEVLAMVGSRNYFDTDIDGKVNVTLSKRQPGSSIKPLNYALGIETKKITPSTMLLDTPICFRVVGQRDYCPKNYDNTFRGLTQIRFALANSYNIPAVKVLAKNDVESFIAFGKRMGITTWTDPSQYGLSLTLGGGEVMMTDMAVAFGVFANSGTKVDLHPILKIEDSQGNIKEEFKPDEKLAKVKEQREAQPSLDSDKVLSSGTSFLISHILMDNNARSAAFGTNSVLNIPGKSVSVKTGTTNNLRDNWTIGYTDSRLVAVWVGNNDNSPMSYVASGVTGASPIWQDLMIQALKDVNVEELYRPESEIVGANVCADSGSLPQVGQESCSTRFEYFLKDTIPTAANIFKRKIFVNKTTNHAPNSEEEFADIEEREQTLANDEFTQDYCLDCAPYPEDYKAPATIFIYSGTFPTKNEDE